MSSESPLVTVQAGVAHAHRFFPAAALVSATFTSREPTHNPTLLTHVTLKFLSEPNHPTRDQTIQLTSTGFGRWGEIDVIGRANYNHSPFRIFSQSEPDMMDIYEAHRIALAAGHDFFYQKVTLERPIYQEHGEEFWWFYSLGEPIKVGVGARTGQLLVTGIESGSFATSGSVIGSPRGSPRAIGSPLLGPRDDFEEVGDLAAQERSTLRNINEAVKIVHTRFPGARLINIKALGKQFAPVTEALKFHLLFQYSRGHVDIFSGEYFGAWEVPVYTEGRITGWHNVPYEATGRDFIVRAKL